MTKEITLEEFVEGPEAVRGMRSACALVARAIREGRPDADIAGSLFLLIGTVLPDPSAYPPDESSPRDDADRHMELLTHASTNPRVGSLLRDAIARTREEHTAAPQLPVSAPVDDAPDSGDDEDDIPFEPAKLEEVPYG